jgi:hypothetical protein
MYKKILQSSYTKDIRKTVNVEKKSQSSNTNNIRKTVNVQKNTTIQLHEGHYASLTTGMSVLVMMAAAVDTHDGSVDTVDWFRVCFENV